jgi:hypothetical protein
VLAAFAATVGALSLACAAGAGSAGRAALAMNLILLFSLALAGFLVNAESIPPSLRWLRQLSTFRYAFEALATSELAGLTLTIQPPGVGSQPGVGGLKGGGRASTGIALGGAAVGGAGGLDISLVLAGEAFLAALGVNSGRLLADVLTLDAFWAAFLAGGVGLSWAVQPRPLEVVGVGAARLGRWRRVVDWFRP